MNKPLPNQTMMQRVVNMQSELQEAIDRGEEQEFIENFAGDVNRLLIDLQYVLIKPSTVGAA